VSVRAGRPDERASWLALAVIVGATWMVALDTTIVNVALHVIGDDLGGGGQVEWIVVAYLLAVCVSQPASGWLADRYGRSRVFLASLVAFTFASIACAAAPTLPFLIGARVVQGLGGGAMMPIGMAIVFGLFPRERHGRAVGVWGLAATLAPAIGPTLGGWLVTTVSWHWLFLINVPIGVVTFAMGIRLLPRGGDRHERPFDALGLFLGCGGLALVVLVLSEGNAWGWRSTVAVVGGAVGLAALAAFVGHELRVEHPLLELRMFQRQPFRVAMGIMMLLFVCQFARLVFIPLQLESLRGESALRVGLLFLPAALVAALMMSIGGRIVDRRGARLPIVVGTAAVSLAVFSLSRLTLDTPLPVIAAILAVQGFGFGLSTPGVLVTGLSDLPSSLTAQGTALRSLLSQVAGAIAVALLSAVVVVGAGPAPTITQSQAGYNDAFTVAAGCALLALVLAFRVPKRPPVHTVEALEGTLVLD
jgi:EmrB/QacA subfamily drug resistance transporter